MRVRYVSTSYVFGSAQQTIERHYHELRDELLGQGRRFALLQQAADWRPAADIHETPDAVVVKLEVAGVREDQIEMTIYDNGLVVSGRREDDADHGDCVCYHEAQVHYGPFRAEFRLPFPVERDAASVAYEHGFLRIHLPKAERASGGPVRQNSIPAASEAERGAPLPAGHADSLPKRRLV
ncbi:MAG: Hsp20/alpha crystallin family protein [Ktedonobacterales bacterium]|jgi:HSP20 family molecular chaperone IbpA